MNSKELKIRTADVSDAERLLEIYAPYVEQTAISFEYTVPTVEEFRRRIGNTLKKYPYLVAEGGGQILGYAYAGSFKARAAYDWAVESSVYVAQAEKHRGVGGKLYRALEAVLREQGILNVNACITSPRGQDEFLTRNSIEFHGHLGYRLVGTFSQCGYKFGRWYDMLWMEKHIGEHRADQSAPLPFDSVRPVIREKYGIE